MKIHLLRFASVLWLPISLAASPLPRAEWGAPEVRVSHKGDDWILSGRRHRVTLDARTLAIRVATHAAQWTMIPSAAGDLIARDARGTHVLGLAEAGSIAIVPYDTGYKTGVKLTLSGWKGGAGGDLGLTLYLTVCLEGGDEDLVFDIAADERRASVRRLDWPGALDASRVDDTVLSNGRGNLLPRNWPREYFPDRRITRDGKVDPSDHSVLQSHLIECWSMSWWGFERGRNAMMVIVETPDDASYRFRHPAGGPTVIGPRWLPTLGRLGYVRTARMCFFDGADYVTLAKRYRRYVMDTGLFVSLREKIARTPGLAALIGTPQMRLRILSDISRESDRYNARDPSANRSLATFDEQAGRLRALKAAGLEKAVVTIAGWPHRGYDHQHPDPLPPPEAAGGWAGMKRLADTCRDLGYPFLFHDQYRDYYADAPSFDPQFAIHEEDDSLPPKAFAGSRFGDWKEGRIPWMRHWDGGRQTYLNARFQLGHLEKNWRLFFEHGIRPQGIYIDVIGYVPPDEDYNPEHPTTRTDAMRGEAALLEWAHHNIGFTSTEAGSDWVIPCADVINESGAVGKCVPVPLYDLVYHDAVLITYGGRGDGEKGLLRGLLFGGVPELPVSGAKDDPRELGLIRQMEALNRRVALLEMTNHEFLGPDRRRERTTFADGTTVTVDWRDDSVAINPPVGSGR